MSKWIQRHETGVLTIEKLLLSSHTKSVNCQHDALKNCKDDPGSAFALVEFLPFIWVNHVSFEARLAVSNSLESLIADRKTLEIKHYGNKNLLTLKI